MLESISNEVRAIGVNYNQAVRALNRIIKKYGNHRALSQDERTEIVELYERLSKQNKAIYERLKTLASDVEALSAKPSVNLTAIGLVQPRPLSIKPNPSAADEFAAKNTPHSDSTNLRTGATHDLYEAPLRS